MVKLVGNNASGYLGWVTKYCRICSRKLIVGSNAIYACPKCGQVLQAYFCLADYKRLHGKCPYCKSELIPL